MQCRGCPLIDAHGPVFGVGPRDASVMLVGEAPGNEECARGEPFVGKAGWVLNVGMTGAGMERKDTYITNVVKCMPYVPGNLSKFRTPTRNEMQFCGSRYLDVELNEVKPNVTVALGGVAMEYLTKGALKGDITAWRGKIVDVDDTGYVPDDDDEVPF